ncbi:prolyl-tRNA synthetase [Salsuginibacillus halophilus]|uniref:Proline--tRNA ligase n=1 Tax=Salsuginibacillus halophilus TaxID=517424 RepID=A0A2P8HYG4_9BACI|nr:proline--tRNA ligase [Salsuginibacillus halophilus]PSL51225.1 prolyl-tRNA synthetase [Salsuginibacillus halophilus]
MKQQWLFSPTLRDVPAGADIPSHQLMLRAGLIKQNAAGIYSYLPLAKRVLNAIETVVREEMNQANGQEVLMPAAQPAELWQESGRYEDYGPELIRLKDRHERDFVLGPTHEEVVTSLVKDELNSYKKLPALLYQIQTKYRDERRPRFGVMRSREFSMKDAYSFDKDEAGLNESYNRMYEAYENIFRRLGLDFRAVEADSGAIGGTDTHEFMVLSDVGEDTIAYSNASNYAANLEIAAIPDHYEAPKATEALLKKTATPGVKTIEDVAEHFQAPLEKLFKSVLFIIDETPVLAVCLGGHEINDVKLSNLYNTVHVRTATAEETLKHLGVEPGFIGPVHVGDHVEVIADYAVRSVTDGITGANEADTHYEHVDPHRDFSSFIYRDIRLVQAGDPAPDGQGTYQFAKGIEVGHVFKLGTKYSEKLGANFLDENGKSQPLVMGCYGIGVTRLLAAIIEQHHDENGIIWPKKAAPFDLHLVTINPKNEAQYDLGETLYKLLLEAGYDVLHDNRKERPGVKFNDSDLYGLPVRISCGKRSDEGIVEVKPRNEDTVHEIHQNELLAFLEANLNG